VIIFKDTGLVFKTSDVSGYLLDLIRQDLTIENPERIQNAKLQLWGWWALPTHLVCYEEQEGWIQVPRGYQHRLLKRLSEWNVSITKFDDQSRLNPVFYPQPLLELRPHQGPAVEAMLKATCGIYEAPPGSGKTITTLAAIAASGQKAVVLVNTTNIAAQWADRCESFLGFRPGIVGDGQSDTSQKVTIALVQTVTKLDEADPFFDEFGFAVLDECHHVSAPSFLKVMNSFAANYRFGVSATPDRQNGLLDLALNCLGDIIFQTTKSELAEQGFLVKPRVVKVDTDFNHPFWSTHTSGPQGNCHVPDCGEFRTHTHRSNYTTVVAELAKDTQRAMLVASKVVGEYKKGHACLVISKRINHLKLIETHVVQRLGPGFRTYMLTGKEKTEERMRVSEEAMTAPCVVFSTLADEALDIPRLDRVFLCWPTRNSSLVTQQIGRIERAHPDKVDAVVYDFVDPIPAMKSQFYARRTEVYFPSSMVLSEA
jgi:superfamily II DNA or RNA helicase